MQKHLFALIIAAGLFVSFANLVFSAESTKNPSIEGTYRLVSRKLPDGKVLSDKDIIGLFTYTKTHRNFNLAWKDAAGKHWSYSLVSTYTLSEDKYSETLMLSILNDEIGGKGATYTMNGSTQTATIKTDGGRIEFKMPFDPVTSVFEGDRMTSINKGVFEDTWEKVK